MWYRCGVDEKDLNSHRRRLLFQASTGARDAIMMIWYRGRHWFTGWYTCNLLPLVVHTDRLRGQLAPTPMVPTGQLSLITENKVLDIHVPSGLLSSCNTESDYQQQKSISPSP